MPSTTIATLLDRYDAFLIDAYGVLVDARGALPGAAALTAELSRRDMPWLIVTNDASRAPDSVATRLAGFGIAVRPDQVVTSGQLIAPHFAARGLLEARCLVLGPDDSRAYVRDAGGVVIPTDAATDYDAIVVCDDAGYPFLESLDTLLSVLYRQIDAGHVPALVLPNPDLVYPKVGGTFGFTSGAVALLIEAALDRRYPKRGLRFARLGKPHRAIFDAARTRLGTDSLVMLGDQLETDIAGARGAGIDAALLTTGVTHWDEAAVAPDDGPTYVVTSLRMD